MTWTDFSARIEGQETALNLKNVLHVVLERTKSKVRVKKEITHNRNTRPTNEHVKLYF